MPKKTVAKPKGKSKVKTDPLADLGLDTPTTETATAAQTATEQAAGSSNEEVDVGDIELGFSEFIPTAKRTGGGSKYKFDQLVAPHEKGGKTLYANFTVKLLDGVDADKLRRSVQSATTQANKQGENEGKYFVSRSMTKDGKFIGMQVFRTDARSKD